MAYRKRTKESRRNREIITCEEGRGEREERGEGGSEGEERRELQATTYPPTHAHNLTAIRTLFRDSYEHLHHRHRDSSAVGKTASHKL